MGAVNAAFDVAESFGAPHPLNTHSVDSTLRIDVMHSFCALQSRRKVSNVIGETNLG